MRNSTQGAAADGESGGRDVGETGSALVDRSGREQGEKWGLRLADHCVAPATCGTRLSTIACSGTRRGRSSRGRRRGDRSFKRG